MSTRHVHRLLNLLFFQASNITQRSFWISGLVFIVFHCNINRAKRDTDKENLINGNIDILDV